MRFWRKRESVVVGEMRNRSPSGERTFSIQAGDSSDPIAID
jgi:hypothetical protein